MCFSAPVSFASSLILMGMGALLTAKVKSKKLLPLALIPCFFAIQQFAEGVVWTHLPEPTLAKNVYLFFSIVFWPFWIPFSLWIIEGNGWRKQALGICLGIGIFTSILSLVEIPDSVAVSCNMSIHYKIKRGMHANIETVFYGIAVLVPTFCSSMKGMWTFGVGGILFAVPILLMYWLCFLSLWCFFAAAVSLGLFFVLKRNKSL